MYVYDVILQNGFIVTEKGISKGNIAVKNGKISKITTSEINKLAEIHIDASNLYIIPGLIDSHVHFNEPGRTDWEGFKSGSKSLAAGGVTTFFDMPLNSSPPTINKEAFYEKNDAGKRKSITNFHLWGGLVPENLENLEELLNCGVIGFKAFMSSSGIKDFQACNDVALLKGMEKIAQLKSILAVHAESQSITAYLTEKMKTDNKLSIAAYCHSRPIESEIEAVERILSYALLTKCKTHIVHVTSSKVVSKINKAKQNGVDVSVETCPHYLSLSIKDFEEKGAIAKCAPPLRSEAEIELLWDCLKRGEIDVIGSDHSPSPQSMKVGNIFESWGGISGAQTTLNVLLEEGYWKRNVSLETIVKLTATNPAKRFQLYPEKGTIKVGSDADLTIIDLDKTFVLKKENLFYKHQQSPFINKEFRGQVMYTFISGNLIYQA
ncbi:allantoinase AllB [Metabacillus litoralis]|uniref:Allantoinase AllB n=1 Tax=Metabacillus litoralis TaxID=152268 RepID=A0A5C6W523_9BACI|nr:allantoinase AllB [Metabacillus litoralis]TXC91518.1 allantoinase AllB [Metabacillus litoralis]